MGIQYSIHFVPPTSWNINAVSIGKPEERETQTQTHTHKPTQLAWVYNTLEAI